MTQSLATWTSDAAPALAIGAALTLAHVPAKAQPADKEKQSVRKPNCRR